MRYSLLTPGTGHFYCGSCLRDNALGHALRKAGHDVVMTPLYLPFMLEGHGADERAPVRMGGINMHLQHKHPAFRHVPRFLTRALDAPGLLRWASKKGNMTDATQLGEMTLSMLRGEEGRQGAEVERLIEWMEAEELPDVVVLSNVMLTGVVRTLKAHIDRPVVVTLQGEAPFLDSLPEPYGSQAWSTLAERAAEVDAFVPVSHNYGELMTARLGLDPARVHVVHNGIDLADFGAVRAPAAREPATIGYLARMCADKGLSTLVEAYRILRRRGRVGAPRLCVAGTMVEADHLLVDELRARLEADGLGPDVEFRPNLERDEKLRFLESLDVLSVPATYGESFGLYLLEAMAMGVPVVQPRHAAFPEVLEATGGGLLCEPDDPQALAEGLERLLGDEKLRARLGDAGQRAVREHFHVGRMASEFHDVCRVTVRSQGNFRRLSLPRAEGAGER